MKKTPTTKQGDLLELLAQANSDDTGVKTFERYVWQAKQALRQWLTCLVGTGPLFIVCEQVDDIALVYIDKVRFLQLKTRDRGSWSALVMCDHGIDALVRSYNAARHAGIHDKSTFELWLEGPISDAKDTVAFTIDPSSALTNVRKKIIQQGLRRDWLDDFLNRLVICPDQPTRAHIDAKANYELSALWPMLSRPELDLLYERLLTAVVAAQAAQAAPATIQAHIAAAQPHVSRDLPNPGEPGSAQIEPIRNQILSHSTLLAVTPPLLGEPIGHLLRRMSSGSNVSMLELKMRSAGASSDLIRKTQALRAEMEIERQLLLASRDNCEIELEEVGEQLISMANAIATRISLLAASNPATGARPAEAIAAELLSRPSDLVQCDNKSLFGGDAKLVFGYLGHLSDQCFYPWRAA